MTIVQYFLIDYLKILGEPFIDKQTVFLGHPDDSRDNRLELVNLEKNLMNKIEDLTNTNMNSDIIVEALINSAGHGNGWDKSKPLGIEIYSWLNAALLRLTDAGPGFDYPLINNELIYQNYGGGFELFRTHESLVSFEGDGQIINLYFLKQ